MQKLKVVMFLDVKNVIKIYIYIYVYFIPVRTTTLEISYIEYFYSEWRGDAEIRGFVFLVSRFLEKKKHFSSNR